MTLTFLGNSYEATLPEVAQIPTVQTGKYRGAAIHFSAARVATPSNRQLTYRGNVYSH